MKRVSVTLLQFVFCLFILLFFKNEFLVFSQTNQAQQKQTYYEATIKNISVKSDKAHLQITSGDLKGKDITVPLSIDERAKSQNYSVNDKVIVLGSYNPGQPPVLYIVDFDRTTPLLILVGLFLLVTLLIGRKHGVFSIISMVFSFFIIVKFIIPNILLGSDPIFIALLGGLFISPVAFYLSHGFNWKTTVALIGTFATLILTGILSVIFVNLTKLSGVSSDEALYVSSFVNQNINLKSLLLAGMIIGLFGILDDITISQAAIVDKLIKTNDKMSLKEIFFHAMDVGKDHIASLVNTLMLVYAGASLPLFLLFYNSNVTFSQAVNSENIATEIVRTLVGSIGLIASVPLTTFLACIFLKKKK
jgi:uncharacterized membrane protein